MWDKTPEKKKYNIKKIYLKNLLKKNKKESIQIRQAYSIENSILIFFLLSLISGLCTNSKAKLFLNMLLKT